MIETETLFDPKVSLFFSTQPHKGTIPIYIFLFLWKPYYSPQSHIAPGRWLSVMWVVKEEAICNLCKET